MVIKISKSLGMSEKNFENEHAKAKYSFLAKFLHWCFVILFAYGIFKQEDNINQLEDIS